MSPARCSYECPPRDHPSGQIYPYHEPVEPHSLIDGVDSLRLVVVDREGPDAVRDHPTGTKITGVVDRRGEDLRSHRYISEMTVRLPGKEAEEGCFKRAETGRAALRDDLFDRAAQWLDLPLKPCQPGVGILVGEIQQLHRHRGALVVLSHAVEPDDVLYQLVVAALEQPEFAIGDGRIDIGQPTTLLTPQRRDLMKEQADLGADALGIARRNEGLHRDAHSLHRGTVAGPQSCFHHKLRADLDSDIADLLFA